MTCAALLVALLDVVLVVVFVVLVLVVAFAMFYFFVVYLALLVVVAAVWVPLTVCVEDLPAAERVLEPYRWVISRPQFYIAHWYAACRAGTRACLLPPPPQQQQQQLPRPPVNAER